MAGQNEAALGQAGGAVRKNSGWLLFMGILLLILGIVGMGMAGMLTVASIFYFGFLAAAGGVLLLIDSFKAEGWKSKIWEILIALLYLAAAVVMINNPAASAVWFTFFIAAFLLASGIFRIIIGFQIRNEVETWGWTVFGGVASIVLAAMIFAQWPYSGLWVIGMFLAIEMVMQGISMITIAMAARAAQS